MPGLILASGAPITISASQLALGGAPNGASGKPPWGSGFIIWVDSSNRGGGAQNATYMKGLDGSE